MDGQFENPANIPRPTQHALNLGFASHIPPPLYAAEVVRSKSADLESDHCEIERIVRRNGRGRRGDVSGGTRGARGRGAKRKRLDPTRLNAHDTTFYPPPDPATIPTGFKAIHISDRKSKPHWILVPKVDGDDDGVKCRLIPQPHYTIIRPDADAPEGYVWEFRKDLSTMYTVRMTGDRNSYGVWEIKPLSAYYVERNKGKGRFPRRLTFTEIGTLMTEEELNRTFSWSRILRNNEKVGTRRLTKESLVVLAEEVETFMEEVVAARVAKDIDENNPKKRAESCHNFLKSRVEKCKRRDERIAMILKCLDSFLFNECADRSHQEQADRSHQEQEQGLDEEADEQQFFTNTTLKPLTESWVSVYKKQLNVQFLLTHCCICCIEGYISRVCGF
jgi:hypothetical protein